MNNFKGTPGKWQHSLTPAGKSKVVDENGFSICTTPAGTKQDSANAMICAAAPELLAFAIDFIEKVESGRAKSTDSYNKAKIAVNKALNIQQL